MQLFQGLLELAVAMVVAVMSAWVAMRALMAATVGLDELDEIRQGNLAVGVLLAAAFWSSGLYDNNWLPGAYTSGGASVKSIPGQPPAGIRVMSLREAMKREPQVIEQHLARHASNKDDSFTALNTAFIEDGAFIAKGSKKRSSKPLVLGP